MKRIFSAIIILTLILSLVPLNVFAATDAIVYTEASTSEVYPGDSFTYSISLSGTYDGYSLEFSKEQAGLTITLVTGEAGVYVDDRGNTWMLSVMGGLNKVSSAKTKLATVTVNVDVNAATGTKEIGFTNIAVSNDIGDRATYTTELANVVVISKPVAATGVTLNKETLSLNTGESETLIATVSPDNATNKTVSWKSSDSTVATVDNNGKVTAVKTGKATITVTTEDGSYPATCKVSVACSHTNTTVHPANASTCLVQGNAEYTTCNDCGIVVSGSDAKLSLLAHSYKDVVNAKYLKSAATCVSAAEYYKSCEVCGSASTTETFTDGGVDGTNHIGGTYLENQKDADCVNKGYTGDKMCSSCRNLVEAGTDISVGEHNPASVWSTDAEYHWKDCKTVGCGNLIDKAPHSGGTATCKNKAVCSVCNVEYGTINADNHAGETEVKDAVEATCTSDGFTGDTYCKDCGVKIADGQVVSAGHKISKVDEVPATHEKDGNIEYYICSGCDKIFSDVEATTEITLADTIIAKGEHDYGDSYENDADNHWKACGCGNIIEKDVHSFGEWSVIKDATEMENGSKEKICSVCGYKVTEEIPVVNGDDTNNTDTNIDNDIDTDANNGTINDDTFENAPQTGDSNNIFLLIAILTISIFMLVVTTVLKKKVR